jgi:hypothetical protein
VRIDVSLLLKRHGRKLNEFDPENFKELWKALKAIAKLRYN